HQLGAGPGGRRARRAGGRVLLAAEEQQRQELRLRVRWIRGEFELVDGDRKEDAVVIHVHPSVRRVPARAHVEVGIAGVLWPESEKAPLDLELLARQLEGAAQ